MNNTNRLRRLYAANLIFTVLAYSSCGGDVLSFLEEKVSSDREHVITAFSFPADVNPALPATVTGTLVDTGVTLIVPVNTDVTALIADIDFSGSAIFVGNQLQESGSTPNNFTEALVCECLTGIIGTVLSLCLSV